VLLSRSQLRVAYHEGRLYVGDVDDALQPETAKTSLDSKGEFAVYMPPSISQKLTKETYDLWEIRRFGEPMPYSASGVQWRALEDHRLVLSLVSIRSICIYRIPTYLASLISGEEKKVAIDIKVEGSGGRTAIYIAPNGALEGAEKGALLKSRRQYWLTVPHDICQRLGESYIPYEVRRVGDSAVLLFSDMVTDKAVVVLI
jgi:hypothetical protein